MPGRRRQQKKPLFTLSRRALVRLSFVVPLAALLAWLSVANSGASIMRSVRPDLALRFQPWDSRAEAKAAEQILLRTRGRGADIASAETSSRRALLRDPTIVAGWRNLGMIFLARRRPEEAARMFHLAGRLSRRDLPTQLWLIEERVQANDVAGALRQYDATLRTSGASYEILLPILVSATARNEIIGPLANLLNTMPPWRRFFLERLASGAPNPANSARLLELIRRSANAEERELIAAAMRTMIERRHFGPGWRIYQLLAGPAPASLLRNGNFDQVNRYPPFDWEIVDDLNSGAELQSSNGPGGQRLRVFGTSGAGGLVARQLLLLPPGTYEAGAVAGAEEEVPPTQLQWAVQCASEPSTVLLSSNFPALARQVQVRSTFRVPAGCEAQWLNLNVRATFGPGGAAGWIDTVSIRRLGN